jgi:hypothetical protein
MKIIMAKSSIKHREAFEQRCTIANSQSPRQSSQLLQIILSEVDTPRLKVLLNAAHVARLRDYSNASVQVIFQGDMSRRSSIFPSDIKNDFLFYFNQ